MWNLANKKILVTGASKGLGQAAAVALANEGAKLALIARTNDALEAVRKSCKNAEQHASIAADLVEPSQIAEAVKKAKSSLGGIDVVLHAAGGGLGLRDPLLGSEDLWKMFMTNLGAAAEINRLVAPEMRKKNSGNLVHVGSIASAEGVGSVGYNSMKAALAAYVRTLGRELAADQVVVTGILPGGFTAPSNAMERLRANKPEVYQNFIDEKLPRKRMGTAEEIVPLLLLLCSDKASMMGGCLVPIDAGEGKAYLA